MDTVPDETPAASLARLNLAAIDDSLRGVEEHWPEIDDELDRLKIGRKDTPFDRTIRARMMSAYGELDELLADAIEPFSPDSMDAMITLNDRVHYGVDEALMEEYRRAREANRKKFSRHIGPISDWYHAHRKRGDHPLKIAAEVYVAILGYPQLFIEGNHRTGSLIAGWINLVNGYPPFVLSVENAISYFAPSSEIKRFGDRSTWRGRSRLPKYRKVFRIFWETHLEERYLVEAGCEMREIPPF